MQKFVAGGGGLVTSVVLDGPPPQTVAEFARISNADLVVAASRGAGDSNIVLLGSNAEALMGNVPCDVAIARVPGRFYRP
ncbi:MAG: universal stress protein [bacterium]|nr:universal stress protein [bacterium]